MNFLLVVLIFIHLLIIMICTYTSISMLITSVSFTRHVFQKWFDHFVNISGTEAMCFSAPSAHHQFSAPSASVIWTYTWTVFVFLIRGIPFSWFYCHWLLSTSWIMPIASHFLLINFCAVVSLPPIHFCVSSKIFSFCFIATFLKAIFNKRFFARFCYRNWTRMDWNDGLSPLVLYLFFVFLFVSLNNDYLLQYTSTYLFHKSYTSFLPNFLCPWFAFSANIFFVCSFCMLVCLFPVFDSSFVLSSLNFMFTFVLSAYLEMVLVEISFLSFSYSRQLVVVQWLRQLWRIVEGGGGKWRYVAYRQTKWLGFLYFCHWHFMRSLLFN